MVLRLEDPLHIEVFDQIKESFRYFRLFDSLVAEKLKQFLIDSSVIAVDENLTKKIIYRYFSVASFITHEQKELVYPLELIFQSTCVLLVAKREEVQKTFWDLKTFIEKYPQFKKLDDTAEIELLLKFRNFLSVALTLIPARLNKGRLLHICGKLEGAGVDYITGSGQKPEVDHRVEIYQQEGFQRSFVKKPRSGKNNPQPAAKADPAAVKITKGSCSSSNFSNAKMMNMKMTSEETERLLSAPPSKRKRLPEAALAALASAPILRDEEWPTAAPTAEEASRTASLFNVAMIELMMLEGSMPTGEAVAARAAVLIKQEADAAAAMV